MEESSIHIVILDVSGLYVQIFDQGWFTKNEVYTIKNNCPDMDLKIIVL